MRYVAAYLLAVLGGNAKPNESDIEKILKSVGVSVEGDKLAIVMKAFAGKNVEQVIAAGSENLATVTSGGIAVAKGGTGTAVAGGGGGAFPTALEEDKFNQGWFVLQNCFPISSEIL